MFFLLRHQLVMCLLLIVLFLFIAYAEKNSKLTWWTNRIWNQSLSLWSTITRCKSWWFSYDVCVCVCVCVFAVQKNKNVDGRIDQHFCHKWTVLSSWLCFGLYCLCSVSFYSYFVYLLRPLIQKKKKKKGSYRIRI